MKRQNYVGHLVMLMKEVCLVSLYHFFLPNENSILSIRFLFFLAPRKDQRAPSLRKFESDFSFQQP